MGKICDKCPVSFFFALCDWIQVDSVKVKWLSIDPGGTQNGRYEVDRTHNNIDLLTFMQGLRVFYNKWDLYQLIIQRVCMQPGVMIFEFFSVVTGEYDHGAVIQVQFFKLLQ